MNAETELPQYLYDRIDDQLQYADRLEMRFRAQALQNKIEGLGCPCDDCKREVVASYNREIVWAFSDEPEKLTRYLRKLEDGQIVPIFDCTTDEDGWPLTEDDYGAARDGSW